MHKNLSMLASLALSIGVALSAQASDIATVRIINDAGEQSVEVDLDSLKVGESRQLASSTGAPALVTRTEDGLSIDVAGKVTEVKLAQPELAHWVSAEGEGKQVHVIHLDHDEEVHASPDGEHKIVMIRKSGDASASDLSEEEIAELAAEIEEKMELNTEGDGQKVIVTRKVIREEAEQR